MRYLGEFPATEVAKRKLVAKLAAKYNSTFCYEAGPTRYGLYRLMMSVATSALWRLPRLAPRNAATM